MKAGGSIRAIPNGMALKLAVTDTAENRIISNGKFLVVIGRNFLRGNSTGIIKK